MKILERLNPTNTGSYNRPIAHALGLGAAVVYAALINKQVYYEQHNMLDEEGFFYSTISDLQESTSMGKCQQGNAIKVLTDAGLVEVCRRGMPAKRYFRVRDDAALLDKFLKQGNKDLNICGIVETMVDNTKMTKEVDEVLSREYADLVYSTKITRRIEAAYSSADRKSLIRSKSSSIGKQYRELVGEIIAREGEKC